METTQTSLLWAVRDAGNREAWHNFYRIYSGLVSRFARRQGLPEADAEDVAQEVMVVAHRSLRDGVYEPAKGRFRNWLYGIARRRALAALRARRRRTRAQWVQREDGLDLLGNLEDHGEEAAQQAWRQEWRYALLDEALRHVPAAVGEKVFKAFTLFAIEHWPAERVAAELGIAPASVYVYKGRVLAAIREWVRQFEDE